MDGDLVRVLSSGREEWATQRGDRDFVILDGPLKDQTLQDVELKVPFHGSHVFGMAINFKCMVGERDAYETPIAFLKSRHSLVLPDVGLIRPREEADVWVEVELALIVGRGSKPGDNHPAETAIFGFTTACDVTRRADYGRDNHLAISKARPGFCPISPYVRRKAPEGDLFMRTWINDVVFQDGCLSNMIFGWRDCYRYLADHFVLEPGDLILCGTPANSTNCLVKPGDRVRHQIEGFTPLTFDVL